MPTHPPGTPALRTLEGIAEVLWQRGTAAQPDAAPDLLLEVPHGATLARDYDALHDVLRGPFPADLRDFFFVNTDVGAPEIAQRVAALVVTREPTRTAAVVRCRIPRTFVDCNRIIDAGSAATSAPGALTPGLGAWVRDPADRALLLERHATYVALVTAAFADLAERGGDGVMAHTYAPRSVDVPVDEDIVRSLHAAYEPDRFARWPLRSEVDLITRDTVGAPLASTRLTAAAQRELAEAGFQVTENGTYALHPGTVAHDLAKRHPDRFLCLEVRRDLIVDAFTPFEEMTPSAQRIQRVAAPLARALARG